MTKGSSVMAAQIYYGTRRALGRMKRGSQHLSAHIEVETTAVLRRHPEAALTRVLVRPSGDLCCHPADDGLDFAQALDDTCKHYTAVGVHQQRERENDYRRCGQQRQSIR